MMEGKKVTPKKLKENKLSILYSLENIDEIVDSLDTPKKKVYSLK
jgi:hypothetical protein